MRFVTDEATGDCAGWLGQCGNMDLVGGGAVGAYPQWDGPGTGVFYAGGRHHTLSTVTTPFSNADHAVYVVGSIDSANTGDNDSLYAGPTYAVRWSYDTGTSDIIAFCNSGSTLQINPANDQLDRPCVYGHKMDYTGTPGQFDVTNFIGETDVLTNAATSPAAVNNFALGGSGSGFQYIGTIYECIVYDRALSTAEHTTVVDYLSNKWSAQNEDLSALTISAGGTAATWQNNNIDKAGEGTLNPPGAQPGEYSIVPVSQVPVNVTTKRPYTSAAEIFGVAPKWHFDAEHTSGMTFATGDATGGTVSSWTDLTGTVTMDTTTSGQNAVNYSPHTKKSRPALYGNATDMSLESSSVTYGTSAGYERLYWVAWSYQDDDDLSTNECIAEILGTNCFVGSLSGFNGDLATGNPAVIRVRDASLPSSSSYLPVSVRPGNKGIYIAIIRSVLSGTDCDVDTWFGGLKAGWEWQNSLYLDGNGAVTVGALAAGTQNSDGYLHEMGCLESNTVSFTDADIHKFAKFLTEKYDEPYMSDTTPLDMGLHARSSGSLAQTDCCLWYRSDKNMGEAYWGLHPDCAALHTSPEDFRLEMYSGTSTATTSVEGGRKVTTTDEVDHWNYANTYNFAETTDFPADTDGVTTLGMYYHDSATVTSNGARAGTPVGYMRFNGTSNTDFRHYTSNAFTVQAGYADQWTFQGAVYRYDSDGSGAIGEPGTPDGDPFSWLVLNDDAYDTHNATASTSWATGFFVGGAVGTNLGIARAREMFAWKHPLVEREIANIKRYLNWRYRDLSLTP
jgi:hypothetical protein